jgi:hypothetical protein
VRRVQHDRTRLGLHRVLRAQREPATAALRDELLWRMGKLRLEDDDFAWLEGHRNRLARLASSDLIGALPYVWRELAQNLQDTAASVPELEGLRAGIREAVVPWQEVTRRVLEVQDRLLAAFAAAGVPLVCLKGAAMRAYGEDLPPTSDVDVLAGTLDDAWAAIACAEELGYELPKLKLISGPACTYGYGELCSSDAPLRGPTGVTVGSVDLHVGYMTTVGEAPLVLELVGEAHCARIGGSEVRVPSVEHMVVVEIAHLARHGTVASRGMNRIVRLLDSDTLDTTAIARAVERNHLDAFAAAILGAIADTYTRLPRHYGSLAACVGPPARYIRLPVRGVAQKHRVERYGASDLSSVALQADVLGRWAIDELGPVRGAAATTAGLARLIRSRRFHPRAHEMWTKRRLGWFSRRQRALVLRRLDRERGHRATGGDVSVGNAIWLRNRGCPDEVLLTPVGAFASAGYDGMLPRADLDACVAAVAA